MTDHPSSPINVVVPNTIEQKMDAIVYISKAILETAKALNSVHLEAYISNNVINTTGGTAISIGHEV
jgi:hypothetical protein